jgi:S-DNA-T family DNA segregation ATPase FtsK/SpoIIIE
MSSPSAPDAARPGRCWTLVSRDGALDVELSALDSETVGSVLPALERGLGLSVPGLWSGSRRLPDDTPLVAP